MKLLIRPQILLLLVCISFMMMLPSCTSETQDVSGHYFIESFDKPMDLSHKLILDVDNSNSTIEFVTESFIDLFKNGKYTMNLNHFEHGTYTFKNGKLVFKRSDGTQWQVKMTYNEEKQVGDFTFSSKEGGSQNFILNKLDHQFKADYPFTLEMNKWRIKDSKSLGTNELIDKMQNYLKFVSSYMIWSNKVKQELNLKTLSGPLRFDNDGFNLRRYGQTGQWCSYFYKDNCDQMDVLLNDNFSLIEIEWNFTHNRINMLANGLDQLSRGLNNYRENFKD